MHQNQSILQKKSACSMVYPTTSATGTWKGYIFIHFRKLESSFIRLLAVLLFVKQEDYVIVSIWEIDNVDKRLKLSLTKSQKRFQIPWRAFAGCTVKLQSILVWHLSHGIQDLVGSFLSRVQQILTYSIWWFSLI
jgi:hypothetical protein